EAVDPRYGNCCELRAVGAVEGGRVTGEPALDELHPEAREDAPRGAAPDDDEGPGGRSPGRDDQGEKLERPPDLRERCPVERARGPGRDQGWLGEYWRGGGQAEHDVAHEGEADFPRPLQQAAVERCHGSGRGWRRGGRGGGELLAPDPLAEDVIGPALVEQD